MARAQGVCAAGGRLIPADMRASRGDMRRIRPAPPVQQDHRRVGPRRPGRKQIAHQLGPAILAGKIHALDAIGREGRRSQEMRHARQQESSEARPAAGRAPLRRASIDAWRHAAHLPAGKVASMAGAAARTAESGVKTVPVSLAGAGIIRVPFDLLHTGRRQPAGECRRSHSALRAVPRHHQTLGCPWRSGRPTRSIQGLTRCAWLKRMRQGELRS